MSDGVRYRVSMSRPHSHLFEVEARFPAGPQVLEAVLPTWTPGSYLIREYARHLQDVTAQTEEGHPLTLRRNGKRGFAVEARGQAVVLRYRVYANELTVRTSHLDGTHGYFNGATLFLYAEALRWTEHRVQVDAPKGWQAYSALDQDGDVFIAPNYDELVDSPFEVTPNKPLQFTAAGVPHEVLIWGGDGRPDVEKWTQDLKRVVEAEAALFGGLPLKRYLIFVYLTDKGRGGLEHKASTALLYPRSLLSTPKGWEDFLTLVSHEYFHLWNVKRIKPKAFVPFDYSQEAFTSLLWAFEGLTSYYDNLLVRRAGLMTPQRYLTRLGESFSALAANPGRRVQPLADASHTAWIKYYRPDENSSNSGVSYYLKGELVGLLLDLELRRATRGDKSLDDLMRLLWTRYGDERGVPEEGVEAAANELGGGHLTGFFDRALRGTEELDTSAVQTVGLELKTRVRESPADKGGSPPRVKGGEVKPRAWLGVSTRGASTLASVTEGSPAMEAGLYSDDELVALDGQRVDAAQLTARCEEKKPGEAVKLTVFRRDRLTEVLVTLGVKPQDACWLDKMENATPEQRAAYTAWCGAPWEDAG